MCVCVRDREHKLMKLGYGSSVIASYHTCSFGGNYIGHMSFRDHVCLRVGVIFHVFVHCVCTRQVKFGLSVFDGMFVLCF